MINDSQVFEKAAFVVDLTIDEMRWRRLLRQNHGEEMDGGTHQQRTTREVVERLMRLGILEINLGSGVIVRISVEHKRSGRLRWVRCAICPKVILEGVQARLGNLEKKETKGIRVGRT